MKPKNNKEKLRSIAGRKAEREYQIRYHRKEIKRNETELADLTKQEEELRATMSKKIVITIIGGGVEDIVADPDLEGYEVEIHDYDNIDGNPDKLEKDSEGVEFRRTKVPLD